MNNLFRAFMVFLAFLVGRFWAALAVCFVLLVDRIGGGRMRDKKTTVMGLLTILAVVVTVALHYFTAIDIAVIVPLFAGFGLLFCRDTKDTVSSVLGKDKTYEY